MKPNWSHEQYTLMAQAMWSLMDRNERTLVRLGMFPHLKMTEAENAGFMGQDLAVALMACATADGGMRA